MTATQTQIRRGTAAQCDAMTPAEGEVIADLTNDRLRLGDGLVAGGLLQASAKDVQNNAFVAANAGGTANDLTLTLSPAPSGYVTHMGIYFKATATNTGAVQVDVNGLGYREIRKVSGGSIVSLAGGDLVNGAYYHAVWDGTRFVLIGAGGGGVTSVSGTDGLTGTVTSTGNISIDTNNSLGVGSVAMLVYLSSTNVANGDTVTGNLAAYGFRVSGGSLTITFAQNVSGTWRNISGATLNSGANNLGMFIRVS